MQQNDWDFYENRFLAYGLNGENEKGKRTDDDFLVMVSGNASSDMMVKLPDMPHKGQWTLVFDTSKPTSFKDEKTYQKGDIYLVVPHSVVVFANRRQKNQENQKVQMMIMNKNKSY